MIYKPIKQFFKITIGTLFLLIVILILFLFVGLKLPLVQKQLGKTATNYLTKKLKTKVQVGRIEILLFDRVALKEVYIEDQDLDTLLSFGNLTVDIDLKKLKNRKIEVDNIILEDVVATLHQNTDQQFNFQFIIDAFATTKKKQPKKSAPWEIKVHKINLKNVKTDIALKSGRQEIALKSLELNINSMDFNNLIFDIDKIIIDQTNYIADFRKTEPPKKRIIINPNLFPLLTVPIVVNCKKLEIKDSYVNILTGNKIYPNDQFNPQNIIASNLNLDFNSVKFDSTEASLKANHISVLFGKYLNVKSLEGILKFGANETSAKELKFKTDNSEANLDVSLLYDQFGSLIQMDDKVDIQIKSKSLDLHTDELAYFVPTINKQFDFKNPEDKYIKAKLDISGSMADLKFEKLEILNGKTQLFLDGEINDLTNFKELEVKDLTVNTATSAKEIKRFIGINKLPFDLTSFGKISINTMLSGSINDLEVSNLQLKTDAQTQIKLSGHIKNIQEFKKLQYDVDIGKLETDISDLSKFVKKLPAAILKIDNIAYTGKAKGSLTEFKVNGDITTNLGNASPNLYINFSDDYCDARYNGDVVVNNFQLGTLLNDSSIGNISLNASLNGQGLSLSEINTNADICIQSVTYNGYNYQDIEINGIIDKRKFTGDLLIEDDNIKLAFTGVAGFNNQVPDFDFAIAVDTINLHALHFLKDTLGMKLEIASKLTGNSLNSLKGDIALKNITLNNNKYLWSTDSITINAKQIDEDINQLKINAPFVEASIKGQYEFDQVFTSFIHVLDEYFPISNLFNSKSDTIEKTDLKPQQFEANIFLSDLVEISRLFTDDLTQFDTATLMIQFESEYNFVNIGLDVPKIIYGNLKLDHVLLDVNTDNDLLDVLLVSDSINVGKKVFIPGIELNGAFEAGIGNYSFYVKDAEGNNSLGTKGKLTAINDLIEMEIDPSFLLDGREWVLSTNENIKIGKGIFEYPSFKLIKDDQALIMKKNEVGDINLYFESFEISQLVSFLLNDSTSIEGAISGSLSIQPSAEPLLIDGDIYLSTLEYNNVQLGNAMMTFQNQGGTTNAVIELSDQYTSLIADITLSNNNAIKGQIDITEFDIKAITPFVSGFISDAKGGLTGSLAIDGTFKKPIIEGGLQLENISAKVNSLGSYYSIKHGTLDFTKNKILTDITFIDDLKRTALLKGIVYHKNLSDFQFDLSLNTNAFTFLQSQKQPGLPFYGMLNAELNAEIKGTAIRPDIFAIFATAANTDITIESISNNNKLSNEPYVIFLDGSNYSAYELDSIANQLYNIKAAFDLTLYANINDSADIKVVIDPISGDYLKVSGNGALVVDIKENGELLVNGVYEVSSGEYRFSYQDLFLKWPFLIRSGSEIVFSGDIMQAYLKMVAAYTLKATTFGLVESEFTTLSEAEKKAVKSLTEISVLLNLEGQLNEPKISFDIEIPEDNANAVSSSVVRSLDKLRTNETELNKQVFSLLLLQGFSSSSITSNIASAGTQVAYNSVTGFINSQLKKLTGKAEGLDVGIGLASNSELNQDVNTTTTNIDVFVQQSLLNDRLVIGLSGNVDLESGSSSSSKGLTNVAGDFILEYKITKDGKLRLSVFQKSDYDVLNDNNVWKSGAGLSYQTTFGSVFSGRNEKNENKLTKKQEQKQKKKNKIEEAIQNDL